MKTHLQIIALTILLFATASAQDGGLTGEVEPVVNQAQQAALSVKRLAQQHGQHCASTLEQAVAEICGRNPSTVTATAKAFFARLGAKGKRTLKWLTDLRDTADAAAPAGVDFISPHTRLILTKWAANPDNTVTVSP